MMHAIKVLTPSINLTAQIDLHWANIITRTAERAGRKIMIMLVWILQHIQIDADRTWDEISIAVATRTTIHRTGVHAGTTTHTFQRLPMFFIAQDAAASIVYQNDVHLTPRTRATEMRRVDGGGLTCSMTRQQALEHSHCLVVGYQLLDAHRDDVKFGHRGAHVRIPFVGANHDVARLCNAEIGTRHATLSGHEVVAQMIACSTCQEGRIAALRVVLPFWQNPFCRMRSMLSDDTFLTEALSHLLACDVDGWHDDMAGSQFHQLKDAFSQIRLHDIYAIAYQMIVEVTFLRQHGFAFHHLSHFVLAKDAPYDLIVFFRILCPMYDGTVACRILLKLLQIVSQMGDGMLLDVAGSLTKVFPFVQLIGQRITFAAYAPEGLVVAGYPLAVLNELLCCNGMFRAHSPDASISAT